MSRFPEHHVAAPRPEAEPPLTAESAPRWPERRWHGALAECGPRALDALSIHAAPEPIGEGTAASLAQDGRRRWRAVVAFMLRPLAAGAIGREDLDRQAQFLSLLLALPTPLDRSVQLRLIAEPDPATGQVRLRLWLLGAASSSGRDEAVAAVRALAGAMALADRGLAPRFELIPVETRAGLHAVPRPFGVRAVGEVGPTLSELAGPDGPLWLAHRLPAHRAKDVVLLDPSDWERPVGYNLLECASADEGHQVVENFSGLLYLLYDPQYTGIIGPRFEHAARNAMLTAMANGLTLVEVVRIMTDPGFVRRRLPRGQDPLVRRYWTDQIANTHDCHRSEVLDYIVSKFSPFVHNPLVRNIIGQARSMFSLRRLMDERGVLLVNLAQGRLGVKLAAFLSMTLVPWLLQTALSRADVPEAERRDFHLYVDEFQSFATPAFAAALSAARKDRLTLTLANQCVGALIPAGRQAIFGNVGSLVALWVGVADAGLLADAMAPSAFAAPDFLTLPNYRAISRVLTEGRRGSAFSLAARPLPG